MIAIAIALTCGTAMLASAAEPIEVGLRLELFVDDHAIDKLTGDAHLCLHKPQQWEVVLVTDRP
ncbi:MAG: hypothetical protein ACOX1P_13840 [Thermoguttaceae bacterium]